MRAKGYVEPIHLRKDKSELWPQVYCEEIPADAVRCECMVVQDSYLGGCYLSEMPTLPDSFKGKKVKVIIFEEDE